MTLYYKRPNVLAMLILLYFITLFIFIIKAFDNLKKEITNMISAVKSDETIKKEDDTGKKSIKRSHKKHKTHKAHKKKISLFKKNKKTKKDQKDDNRIELNIINKKVRKSVDFSGQITLNLDNIDDKSIKRINEDSSVAKGNTKVFLEQKDFEINSLEYEEAIKLDNRNFFQYYFSLIKNNHPLIVSFVPIEDYNSFIIKIFLFFFSFSLDLTINALFFTDESMHKIHEDKGAFDFLYNIPQILYSTLISRFISGLINKFALSQDNILSIKEEKNKNNLDDKYFQKLVRTLKIKFTLFFIICLSFLLLFWYYVTCFCGVYINTQMHLIKDSLMSTLTSFIMPFWQYLIPGIFRIPALKVSKPTRKYMYKLASFIENYIDLI